MSLRKKHTILTLRFWELICRHEGEREKLAEKRKDLEGANAGGGPTQDVCVMVGGGGVRWGRGLGVGIAVGGGGQDFYTCQETRVMYRNGMKA